MSKRVQVIIVAAAGLLLVVAIIVLIIAKLQVQNHIAPVATNNDTVSVVNTTIVTTNSTDTAVVSDTTPVVTATSINDATSITRLARNFTERYTSYSTDTHYENIEQSRSMMTAAMSTKANQTITGNDQDNAIFYSVVTQTTGVKLTDFVEGATGATVEVAVRQTITTGQADPTYQNRTARLTFKKDGVAWKVDSFRWL